MSIPWQRYTGGHARTVDTMTAAFLVTAFRPGSDSRLPGPLRPDAKALDPERSLGPIGLREGAQSGGGALRAGRPLEGGCEVITRPPLYPTAP
ncbi:hypothetical protein [Streptomyces sp. NPDC001604]|uniref:hypothetical protein n=1 Tax=Streptomyces sp. NPDC001604 TaxID=3364593 RepID=UPI00368D52D1